MALITYPPRIVRPPGQVDGGGAVEPVPDRRRAAQESLHAGPDQHAGGLQLQSLWRTPSCSCKLTRGYEKVTHRLFAVRSPSFTAFGPAANRPGTSRRSSTCRYVPPHHLPPIYAAGTGRKSDTANSADATGGWQKTARGECGAGRCTVFPALALPLALARCALPSDTAKRAEGGRSPICPSSLIHAH